MAGMIPGLDNLPLGNLNNQMMGGFGNALNIGSLNNVGDFANIGSLDNFLSASMGENSDMLQGAVTKIQQGETIGQDEMANLSSEDRELVSDLKQLLDKPTIDIGPGEGAGPKEIADKFSNLLDNYIEDVNKKHKNAAKAIETFATGGNIDIHSVMIASEKASLSMQLAMQLKSKLLGAYKEISRMRV